MAFISSQNGQGSVVTQRTNDAFTSNQPTLKATVASVDPDILQIPIPPNETHRQWWCRNLLTRPILTLELNYDMYMSPVPCPLSRTFPSLLTALHYPNLILPKELVPADSDFDSDCAIICATAYEEVKSKKYRKCHTIKAICDGFPTTTHSGSDYSFDPFYRAVMYIASGDSEKERVITEYRTYYELVRSGRFNLDFFDALGVIAESAKLPSQFVYPDAIAWPYGLFQDLVDVDEDYVHGLLIPQFGRTIGAYYSMTEPGSLPAKAKGALIETLKKIHQCGYIHGKINEHTIRVDLGIAVFTSFECAEKCDDEELKQKEMRKLLEVIG